MRDEPVTIVDRDVLKVLATDTRVDILKMLAEGERTPSFVANKLDKSDATIVEHLHELEKVGLVKKTSAPRKKWVFYSLTERGQGIISSKSRRLVIILSSSLISLAISAGTLASYFYNAASYAGRTMAEQAPNLVTELPEKALGGAESADVTAATNAVTTFIQSPAFLLDVSLLFLIAATIGFGFYFYNRLKMERRMI